MTLDLLLREILGRGKAVELFFDGGDRDDEHRVTLQQDDLAEMVGRGDEPARTVENVAGPLAAAVRLRVLVQEDLDGEGTLAGQDHFRGNLAFGNAVRIRRGTRAHRGHSVTPVIRRAGNGRSSNRSSVSRPPCK